MSKKAYAVTLNQQVGVVFCMNKYINPKRIVAENDVDDSALILADNNVQAVLDDRNCIRINNKGYILLDFGKELNGGIVVTIQAASPENTKLRIVFGESVTEALSDLGENNSGNDHSLRDMTFDAVAMSTQRFGETGFRFVKLEAVGGDISVRVVKAVPVIEDKKYLGSFKCSDELLNTIWETGAYTVLLNMHEYIWDGVKRDRLVWIGDMHPETLVIQSVFGDDDCIRKSLDMIRDNTLPNVDWMNKIPTYTFWWIIIHHDIYMHWNDLEYLEQQRDYMLKLADKLADIVECSFKPYTPDVLFVDWSSVDHDCEIEGVKSIACIALKHLKKMLEILGENEAAKKCGIYHNRLKEEKVDDNIEINNRIAALTVLAERNSKKSLDKMLSTTEYEMSCFMGFYILNTLSMMGNNGKALELIRRYWGAMLKLGATTFWEEFKMDWAKNAARIDEITPEGKDDIHRDFGEYCYERCRLSLCHGWASGPTAFLMKSIGGIKILEPGCKKLAVKPDLSGLEWADIVFPTPYGSVHIECRLVDGKTEAKISAPDEIEIVTE